MSTAIFVDAANWPQFRGPNGSGVAAEGEKPPLQFSPEMNVLWKLSLPSGSSSPCIWENRIFLTGFETGALKTICIDRGAGKILWSRAAPAWEIEHYYQPDGSPAASTPATDGKIVVSYFGSSGAVAYDFEGKELWRREMPVADTAGFGSGASPVLADGLVLINRDQRTNSSLMALDLASGKTVWKKERPEFKMGYSTPGIWRHDGMAEVVLPGFLLLKSYDLKTGDDLWTVQGLPGAVCTSPVFGGGLVYVAAWSNGSAENPFPPFAQFAAGLDKNKDGVVDEAEFKAAGMTAFLEFADLNRDGRINGEEWEALRTMARKGNNSLLGVRPGGRKDVTSTHVAWKQTSGLPYVASPLYYAGRIYVVKDGGLLSCFDAPTGKPVYLQERLEAPGSYFSSPLAAGGKVYLCSVDGKVTVVEPADQLRVIARTDLKEKVYASPAALDDTLYVRTAGNLYAFKEAR